MMGLSLSWTISVLAACMVITGSARFTNMNILDVSARQHSESNENRLRMRTSNFCALHDNRRCCLIDREVCCSYILNSHRYCESLPRDWSGYCTYYDRCIDSERYPQVLDWATSNVRETARRRKESALAAAKKAAALAAAKRAANKTADPARNSAFTRRRRQQAARKLLLKARKEAEEKAKRQKAIEKAAAAKLAQQATIISLLKEAADVARKAEAAREKKHLITQLKAAADTAQKVEAARMGRDLIARRKAAADAAQKAEAAQMERDLIARHKAAVDAAQKAEAARMERDLIARRKAAAEAARKAETARKKKDLIARRKAADDASRKAEDARKKKDLIARRKAAADAARKAKAARKMALAQEVESARKAAISKAKREAELRLQSTGSKRICSHRAERREVMDLTDAEWKRFVVAVKGLHSTADGNTGRTTFETFVLDHAQQEVQGHRGQYFLVWHRQYLYEFERALQKIDPSVSIPYWDWSREYNSWSTSRIWSRLGRKQFLPGWKTTVPNAHEVERAFNFGMPVGNQTLERAENIKTLVEYGDRITFQQFSWFVEIAHGAPHIVVGGDMGDGLYSPNPLFFLHHAYVDRIWLDWQNAGGGNKFGGTHRGTAVSRSQKIFPTKWGRTVDEIFKSVQPCVTYAVPQNSVTGRRLATAVRDKSQLQVQNVSNVDTLHLQHVSNAMYEQRVENWKPDGGYYLSDDVSTLDTKIDRVVAEKAVVNKILNPKTYRKLVLSCKAEEYFIRQCAKTFSHISENVLQSFATNRRVVVASTSKILIGDIDSEKRVYGATPAELQNEGISQLTSLDYFGSI